MKSLKIINIIIATVLGTVLVVAGVYLQGLYKLEVDNKIPLKTVQACDLGKAPCKAILGNKSVTLTLQKPIRYLQKIKLTLDIDGFEKDEVVKVLVDFSMPGMQMGINRFTLKRTGVYSVWQGMAIIPVCVTGRKDWQVKVSIDSNMNHYIANYQLTVER